MDLCVRAIGLDYGSNHWQYVWSQSIWGNRSTWHWMIDRDEARKGQDDQHPTLVSTAIRFETINSSEDLGGVGISDYAKNLTDLVTEVTLDGSPRDWVADSVRR